MPFINNIKGAFASDEAADRGSLVETVLIIAGFAVVAILVVMWIGNAIAGSAANVAHCIAGANGNDLAVVEDGCTGDYYNAQSTVNDQIEGSGRFSAPTVVEDD